MAAQGGEHVYATLLLNDAYLPGALVLAHSLRDAGTKKKLAVLVTLDSVSADVITQLKTVYDHIISVPRIRNEKPANLFLMNRGDLHSAFTKINLWKQTQFSKIVYIDADVVAYRAPDELFDIDAPFSAAPDIGWPDLFNSGVMVLTPNMGDYYALTAMAERGISFDGADQGLLNLHFKNTYNRLSFSYNVTPSAHYQYIPAYKHFQSGISMVHFIGSEKPWFQGRHASKGDSPFDEMVGRWWAVYDRHYRVQESAPAPQQQHQHQAVPEIIQYFVKGEFQPKPRSVAPTGEHYYAGHHDPSHERSSHQPPSQWSSHDDGGDFHHQYHHHHDEHHDEHQDQHQDQHHEHHHHHQHHYHHQEQHHHDHGPESQPRSTRHQAEHSSPPSSQSFSTFTGTQAEARQEQIPVHHERDPPLPPPVEQKHEPSPPPVKTWDAQRQPPPSDSRPEAHNFPVQVYEMSQDPAPFVPPERYPSPPKNMWYEVPREPPTQKSRAIFPWETHQPRPSRIFTGDSGTDETGTPFGSSTTGHKSEPITPATPTIRIVPSDPWTAFTRTNAWDEVPEIERYVEGLQKHRRVKSQGSGTSVGQRADGSGADRGLKLTDFPSEVERPSLPVTPAPIRRPKFWGGGGPGTGDGDDEELLPAAEGVPPQSDWDPVAQLQKLARQQSEVLLRKLGGGDGGQEGVSRDIPARSLPFGSEGVRSPTYVAQSTVLSPQPVKGNTTTSMVRNIVGDRDTSSTPRTASMESTATTVIQEPSYGGPGLAWEKDEDFPTYETPMPPTEEERDILDN